LSLVVPSATLAKTKPQIRDTFVSYIFRSEGRQDARGYGGKKAEVQSKDGSTSTVADVHHHYEIKDSIGEGNFAAVHEAIDRRNGSRVAMKIVDKKKFFQTSALRREQLTDEIEIMKACRHPNIISVLDVFHTPDQLYLALELCDGGDLFDAVVEAEFFDEDRAKSVFAQLASAVGYIHSRHIAHRDLKV
jgi:serine/threonine protein kinase